MRRSYTSEDRQKLADKVLSLLPDTTTPLACNAAGVPEGTFLGWVSADKQLAESYALARTLYPEKLVGRMMELTREKIALDNHGKTDSGRVQQIKVEIDAIKWIVARLLYRKYGDRLTLAGDDEQPLTVVKIERTVVDPRKKEDDEG